MTSRSSGRRSQHQKNEVNRLLLGLIAMVIHCLGKPKKQGQNGMICSHKLITGHWGAYSDGPDLEGMRPLLTTIF